MVKKYLTAKGYNYHEVNVELEPERRQEAIELSGGAMTVPVTVVTAGADDDMPRAITGYNPAKLAAVLS
jgi:glutaredoxin